jgi:hypothetical protein
MDVGRAKNVRSPLAVGWLPLPAQLPGSASGKIFYYLSQKICC